MKIRVKSLSVDEALQILETMGSSNDPIFFRGKEIEPNDFLIENFLIGDKPISFDTNAADIRIKFYGKLHGKFLLRTGSLYTMVLDRLQHE